MQGTEEGTEETMEVAVEEVQELDTISKPEGVREPGLWEIVGWAREWSEQRKRCEGNFCSLWGPFGIKDASSLRLIDSLYVFLFCSDVRALLTFDVGSGAERACSRS